MLTVLSTAERTHLYLKLVHSANRKPKAITPIHLTCKTFKQELDNKYMIQLLCNQYSIAFVDKLSFHTIYRLHYDTDSLLASSCRNLDTDVTKMCILVMGRIDMPLLDKLIISVITYSTGVHPLIGILLKSRSVTFDYISMYAALAWEYKNDALGLYFLDILEERLFTIVNVIEKMCKKDMIMGFRRIEKYWRKIPLQCFNEALRYKSLKIINYLTTSNGKVKMYCSSFNSNSDRTRRLRELEKYGLCYIVEYFVSLNG